jgi:3-dehydroquinate synthase
MSASTSGSASLLIRAGQGDYPVEFLDDVESVAARVATYADRVVVMDRKVAALYPALHAALQSAPVVLVDATEDDKSLRGVEKVLDFVQRHNGAKRTVLVAVGGGIVQDIVTVAAHLYYRGIRWMYVPTTLLSMADSCIGAKGAVNLNAFKNQIGTFHAPASVLLWPGFMNTLEQRDIRSGYGEILKLHVIGSEALFEALAASLARDGMTGASRLRHVRDSLAVKQAVIEEDEYELDRRRILNYGHTFGHALEAVTEHEVAHGLAVVWGMDVANHIAVRLGVLSAADARRIRAVIDQHFRFPLSHPVTAAELFAAARRDKKASADTINLALPEGLGRMRIVSHPLDAALEGMVAEYLAERPFSEIRTVQPV